MSAESHNIRDREFQFTMEDFNYLRNISNERTGIVVSDDKFDMFYSRLSRRVRKLGMSTFREYCDFIRSDKNGGEIVELVNSITTNLTAFFRENHHFVYLKNIVIPEFADRSKNEIMHIWSAGCSTGEEPYSISITLNEALKKNPKIRVKIIATDIDSKVLGRAAAGINTIERVAGLKKNELKHWFLKGTGKNHGFVRLKPEIRKIIEFGQLNLMENWQLETMQDLVFFRNVLIYFDRASKMKLINRIADHLKEGGYLFIGHSESLFKLTDRFELIGQTIYRKIK